MTDEKQEEILEVIREQDLSINDLSDLRRMFPEENQWELRRLLGEVSRERIVDGVEVEIRPTLTKRMTQGLPASTALAIDAGFFQPIRLTFNFLPVPEPAWPKRGEHWLVFADSHFPDHDAKWLSVMIQIGHAVGIDRIVADGDLFDVHSLSRHVQAADRPVRWVDERTQALEQIAYLRANFPGVPFDFIPGNHDRRVHKWIDANAVQLQGLFSLEFLLGLDDPQLQINTIHSGRIVVTDDLVIKHGTLISKHGGASVQKEIEQAQSGVLMGHVHRAAMIHATRGRHELAGKPPLVGVELGCGCNLRPDYLPVEDTANWQHAFAIVTVIDGRANVELVLVHDGSAIFRGRVFTSTDG